MKARQLFEQPEAPPVEAPPKTRPAVEPGRPAEHPGQPEHPDPWRRRDIDPGEEPGPKGAYGMDQTYADSRAQRVAANLLEDADQTRCKCGHYLEKGRCSGCDRRPEHCDCSLHPSHAH